MSAPETLLRLLVKDFVYADPGNALPVTLLCGGRIVAGEIVTPERWSAEVKSFVASGHGTAIEYMLETLVRFGEAHAGSDALGVEEIATLYLINAAVALTGDAVAPASVVRRPWAVQVDQVAAWSLGTVLPSS
ncbi:hypothetical protein [Pseudonocardia sp.]|uniref:hypothetical protein n=1 Tax=Pseudonocardia sp. TaxID=60912 RepID=UPI00260B9B4A|nr:hypothetical protein [Pseudonocardia sp.]